MTRQLTIRRRREGEPRWATGRVYEGAFVGRGIFAAGLCFEWLRWVGHAARAAAEREAMRASPPPPYRALPGVTYRPPRQGPPPGRARLR